MLQSIIRVNRFNLVKITTHNIENYLSTQTKLFKFNQNHYNITVLIITIATVDTHFFIIKVLRFEDNQFNPINIFHRLLE